jgi:TPP-dependent pyruvate/acetoin dehydrogenase alpha subunit
VQERSKEGVPHACEAASDTFNKFQCTRTIGKPRCDWCEDNDYACSMNNELDESMNGKRRKLSKQKCASCRMQKIKVNHIPVFDAGQLILMV